MAGALYIPRSRCASMSSSLFSVQMDTGTVTIDFSDLDSKEPMRNESAQRMEAYINTLNNS